MMNTRIQEVTDELARLSAEAEERFGGLSAEQLNWKPDDRSWSVAQCLDHLITIHRLYFPIFEDLLNGKNPTLWERISPFSGLFGKLLIRALHPDNRKKTKTTAKAKPAIGRIDESIIERFVIHQAELIDHIRKIPDDVVPSLTVISSPLSGLVTYSLDDGFTIITLHIRRHFAQAQRVMETDGFSEIVICRDSGKRT